MAKMVRTETQVVLNSITVLQGGGEGRGGRFPLLAAELAAQLRGPEAGLKRGPRGQATGPPQVRQHRHMPALEEGSYYVRYVHWCSETGKRE
jgi:hypothetical protein